MGKNEKIEKKNNALKAEIEMLRKENDILKAEIERLKELIQIDLMTGLRSKYTIGQDLERAIEYSRRYPETTLSIIFADLDYFKKINDIYGHLIGDKVLIFVADLLKRNLRSYDLIGRYGGEEFLIILQKTNLKQAKKVAEKLRRLMYESFFEFVNESGINEKIHMTMSFGIAEWKKGIGAFELIERADKALYQAKRLGRNRVECWENENI